MYGKTTTKTDYNLLTTAGRNGKPSHQNGADPPLFFLPSGSDFCVTIPTSLLTLALLILKVTF